MTTEVAVAPSRAPAKLIEKPKQEESVTATTPASQPISVETIRMCAYLKWEAAGKPQGDDCRFWFEAEQELRQKK
jgi:DUF2934 family protein